MTTAKKKTLSFGFHRDIRHVLTNLIQQLVDYLRLQIEE